MKKQSTITKILIQAAVVLVGTAVVSSASAQTVAFGDFDNDELMDMAVLTSPTTITVSLANLDGTYTVSAILSVPSRQPVTYIGLFDRDGDGFLDVNATGAASGTRYYTDIWSGNGDGTFDARTTVKWSWPSKGNHGSF